MQTGGASKSVISRSVGRIFCHKLFERSGKTAWSVDKEDLKKAIFFNIVKSFFSLSFLLELHTILRIDRCCTVSCMSTIQFSISFAVENRTKLI